MSAITRTILSSCIVNCNQSTIGNDVVCDDDYDAFGYNEIINKFNILSIYSCDIKVDCMTPYHSYLINEKFNDESEQVRVIVHYR